MHTGYLQDMFEISEVNRGRGHQHKLVMKQSRTRLWQSFFARRAIGHWYRLSKDIVSVDTLEAFKMRLDKHFIGEKSTLQIFMGLDQRPPQSLAQANNECLPSSSCLVFFSIESLQRQLDDGTC